LEPPSWRAFVMGRSPKTAVRSLDALDDRTDLARRCANVGRGGHPR
jgi:hypothetical protein